jgi:hypothetical protein
MTQQATYKLGRLPSRRDRRTLRLAHYRRPRIVAPPAARLWHNGITDWGVMGNNNYGNCVIVTAAHMLLCWRANELDDTKRLTDSAVIELSTTMGALDGYNILDRLNYWRQKGMWSDRLWLYAAVDPSDPDEVKAAINDFGGLDIGLNMPRAWQDKQVWDTGTGLAYRPNSWGGHSVPVVGYDADNLYVVTWGAIQKLTYAALATYSDEAYALVDENWLAKDGITPSAFDLPALYEQLKAITG